MKLKIVKISAFLLTFFTPLKWADIQKLNCIAHYFFSFVQLNKFTFNFPKVHSVLQNQEKIFYCIRNSVLVVFDQFPKYITWIGRITAGSAIALYWRLFGDKEIISKINWNLTFFLFYFFKNDMPTIQRESRNFVTFRSYISYVISTR